MNLRRYEVANSKCGHDGEYDLLHLADVAEHFVFEPEEFQACADLTLGAQKTIAGLH